MTKKQLKQKVAECFGDKNITTKSQHIRDTWIKQMMYYSLTGVKLERITHKLK